MELQQRRKGSFAENRFVVIVVAAIAVLMIMLIIKTSAQDFAQQFLSRSIV